MFNHERIIQENGGAGDETSMIGHENCGRGFDFKRWDMSDLGSLVNDCTVGGGRTPRLMLLKSARRIIVIFSQASMVPEPGTDIMSSNCHKWGAGQR